MPMTVAAPCKHHWRIETPHGETSEAVCELCPATRTFVNYKHDDYTIPPSKERDD